MLLLVSTSGVSTTLTNMKVAISTNASNDSYWGYTSVPIPSFVLATATPYFFPYQISRQFKLTSTTPINLNCAPTWTGAANAVSYDPTCALQIMRIA